MNSVKLHLIFARAANGVIGNKNALPWHLPEDMAHFKKTTLGCPVLMGRKTWDSLPPRFRPLPGRLNVVLTRQPNWNAPGALSAHSLPDACALCPEASDAWVIGGAELYAQALPLANSAVVTEIDTSFDGDAFAPQFGPEWREAARERHVSTTGLKFSFVTYRKTQEFEMSGDGFHVHGPHDHELEHAQQGGYGDEHGGHSGMINQIAMFTAIIATIGAIFGAFAALHI